MPILATVGSYVSSVLHQVIFSMPSSGDGLNDTLSASANATASSAIAAAAAKTAALLAEGVNQELVDAMEPGDARAFVGGIGPPSFLGSGYGVVLVVVALLLNRIHAVVHRPRPPAQPLPHPEVQSLYWRARQQFTRIITSPAAPRYLRVPGILFLIRAWALFTILTLQVAGLWPRLTLFGTDTIAAKVLGRASRWAGGMEMKTACWEVFVGVCTGLICSGLANGLERRPRRDVGAGFNLFGYSFLLHLYSSPLTHHHPPPSVSHGRPDLDTLIQLWLGLTELTWLQIYELSDRTRGRYLIPTGICGILGLTHFVYVLIFAPFHFPSFTFLTHVLALFLSLIILATFFCRAVSYLFTYGYVPSPIFAHLAPRADALPTMEDDIGATLLKLGVACLESTQFSGLKNELIGVEERPGPWVQITPTSADISRSETANGVGGGNGIGNGNGNAGGRGGFGTEVKEIDVAKKEEQEWSVQQVRLHRRLVVSIFYNILGFFLWTLLSTPGGKTVFDHAVRMWRRRWWYGPRQWKFWKREAWVAPPHLRVRAVGMSEERIRSLIAGQRRAAEGFYNPIGAQGGRTMGRRRGPRESLTVEQLDDGDGEDQGWQRTELEVPYAEYLRGEVELVDDEDDEWVPGGAGQEMDDDDEEGWSDYGEEHGGEGENWTTGQSSRARSATPGFGAGYEDDNGDEGYSSVLLAHASYSGSPLTRRRYNDLLAKPGTYDSPSCAPPSGISMSSSIALRPSAGNVFNSSAPQPQSRSRSIGLGPQASEPASLHLIAMERRVATLEKERDEWDDDRRRCCVVCTVEPRDTILWPCRCLAMCNDCRESLSERLSAKDHMCPCCRKKVDGFSRIYIP